MQGVLPGLLGFGVATVAGDLLGSGLVDRPLDVCMAIDAGEHGAVDGVLELCSIDVEAGGLAVDIAGERFVGVAGEAVGVFRLWRGVGRGR